MPEHIEVHYVIAANAHGQELEIAKFFRHEDADKHRKALDPQWRPRVERRLEPASAQHEAHQAEPKTGRKPAW